MNSKAPRRYSHVRNFGQEGFDVPRRRYAPYHENRDPTKQSRNLVWTSKEFQGNRFNGSTKSPVVGRGRGYYAGSSPNPNPNPRGPKTKEILCRFWKAGNCRKGDQCSYLHSWSSFPGLTMVAALEGHKKEIKGIALPEGSDKLFSASIDGALCIWDCNTGQCVQTVNLQAEAGSLISEGPWVFLGLPNAVKAFNVQTSQDLHLNGVVGQVHAMAYAMGMLFAGTSSGTISVWKATENESDPLTYLTSLQGHHSGQVTCFTVGCRGLYSGSVDKTIKVWDLNTLQCTMTLRQHTDTVTSLLCWDQYLISSSLDGTTRVWANSDNASLQVIHTRREEQSVQALSGMHEAKKKPIMFCSYLNGTLGLVDLPTFAQRGNMFSTNTIGTIEIGPDGFVFTGDKSGKLCVWSFAASKA